MKYSRAFFFLRTLDLESFAGLMKSPRNSRILDPAKISRGSPSFLVRRALREKNRRAESSGRVSYGLAQRKRDQS